MKTNKLNGLSIKFDVFFNSRGSFVFAFIFYSTLGLIQLILLSVGIMQNNSAYGDGYMGFIICGTTIAGLITMIQAIYTARIKTIFFVFSCISLAMGIVNATLIKYGFDLLKIIILFLPTIIRGRRGKTNQIEKIQPRFLGIKKGALILLIIIGLSILLAGGISYTNLYNNSYAAKPYIDILNFSIGLYGALLLAYGFIEGGGSFIFTSILLFTIFGIEAQGSTLSTVVLFFFVNQGTGLAGYSKIRENNLN